METQNPKLSEFKMINLDDEQVENVDLENRIVTLTNGKNAEDIGITCDINKKFIDELIKIKKF